MILINRGDVMDFNRLRRIHQADQAHAWVLATDIKITSVGNSSLKCDQCGTEWQPERTLVPGNGVDLGDYLVFPDDWWMCPNYCNEDVA